MWPAPSSHHWVSGLEGGGGGGVEDYKWITRHLDTTGVFAGEGLQRVIMDYVANGYKTIQKVEQDCDELSLVLAGFKECRK